MKLSFRELSEKVPKRHRMFDLEEKLSESGLEVCPCNWNSWLGITSPRLNRSFRLERSHDALSVSSVDCSARLWNSQRAFLEGRGDCADGIFFRLAARTISRSN